MQDAIWYHGDATGQHGPFTAPALREGLADGSVSTSGLFWREGMADWVPLAAIAAEVGVAPPPVPVGALPDGVVPAGFLRRWAAHIVDRLILLVPLCAIVFVLAVELGERATKGDFGLLWLLFAVIPLYFLAAGLYYAAQESSARQATPGKRLVGIKVVDDTGRRLSFGHALGRWFATALSYLTFDVGFLMAAFTERKQALHDLIARTQVVDRWAYSDQPARQQRETSGCVIAVLVGVVVMMLMVPILAAIAVAQFEDYAVKAQVSEAPSLADGVKTAVDASFKAKGTLPSSNEAAGVDEPEALRGQYVSAVTVHEGGRIEVTFDAGQVGLPLRGTSLEFVPVTGKAGITRWTCRSHTIAQKFCPRSCACL